MTDIKSSDKLALKGRFNVQHFRKGVLIDEWEQDNLVVNQGRNYALNVALHGAGQIGTWYVGVFEGNYTPLAADTGTNFPTDATECVAYTESARPTYDESESTAQSITNIASRAVFTFNANKTIYGAFLISASTKGATGGTLFAAARFATARNVQDTDELRIAYTING